MIDSSMSLVKAKRIQELRAGKIMHSMRKIATIIEQEFPLRPELSGNQVWGNELLWDALIYLYGDKNNLSDEILEKWGL